MPSAFFISFFSDWQAVKTKIRVKLIKTYHLMRALRSFSVFC